MSHGLPERFDDYLLLAEEFVDHQGASSALAFDADEQGVVRLMLNGDPLFQYGTLDQGSGGFSRSYS